MTESPPIPDAAAGRLLSFLAAWEATPYMPGQSLVQVGVDCVRFVNAANAAIAGVPAAKVPRHAQDAGLHDPQLFRSMIRFYLRNYPGRRTRRDEHVAPGDTIVIRRENATNHCAIAGFGTDVWHATRHVGVVKTSLAALASSYTVRCAYRQLIMGAHP